MFTFIANKTGSIGDDGVIAPWFIFHYWTHIISWTPTLIVLYLENKKGFRINSKFLKNNKFFIPYLILSIPALIIEIIWLLIGIGSILAFIPDTLANIHNTDILEYFDLLIYPCYLKYLFLYFI